MTSSPSVFLSLIHSPTPWTRESLAERATHLALYGTQFDMRKIRRRATWLVSLTLLAMPLVAQAAEPFRFDSPVGVVMRLYHDFSFQAVFDQNGVPYDDILNQPKAVLDTYFTRELTNLILAERKCAAARGGICNIDFMPLWASQDATGVTVEISQGKSPDEVIALLTSPGETDKLELTYALVKTDRGWRVRDIRGTAWSLVSTLRGQ